MRMTYVATFWLVAVGLLMPSLLTVQAEARGRDRYVRDDGWHPSVGRNAPEAIASGLAAQGAGWLDTMANFYADPRTDNRGYFDYYRRPDYGWPRTRRGR